MKKVLIGLVAICLSISLQATETADSVLQKYLEAMGHSKLMKVNNMSQKSRIEVVGMQISGEGTSVSEGNKVYNKMVIAGTTAEQGYDGKNAWAKDLQFGVRDLEGREAYGLVISTLESQKFPKRFYDSISLAGEFEVDGQSCYRLQLKKKDMPLISIDISKKDFKALAMRMTVATVMGDVPTVTYFKEYKRHSSGYEYCSEAILSQGPMKLKMTVTELKINTSLKPSVFTKPQA